MASQTSRISSPKRRLARAVLGWVMWGGIALALWPLAQKGYGWWSQRQLMATWSQTAKAPKPATAPKPKAKSNPKTASRETARAVTLPVQNLSSSDAGQSQKAALPATRLRIAEIGVDAIVVQGLDEKSLASGPGHDPNSALPGQAGNCVLAAHRNVYGAWFYRVDELWAGSKIELETPQGRFEYEVLLVQTVSESDHTVLRSDPNSPPQLTLITCTLPHSPNRIIVMAQMVS